MPSYKTRSYGRYLIVTEIFQCFIGKQNLSMPGPRRLGKSFVLDRIVESAPDFGYRAIKCDVAGLGSVKALYRYLCETISQHQASSTKAGQLISQRLSQFTNPRQEQGSTWYSQLIHLDHQSHLERQLANMSKDEGAKWVLLIDELPIFLKALHDTGSDGIMQARQVMNHLAQLQAKHPEIRWLVTGSIGFGPLAKQGQYEALLTKHTHFELSTLTENQAWDYLQDLATEGHLSGRSQISMIEKQIITTELRWLSAYYLREIASRLQGQPDDDPVRAKQGVEQALSRLMQPMDGHPLSVWEEHLRKHYTDEDRRLVMPMLNALAKQSSMTVDALMAALAKPEIDKTKLLQCLQRLHVEGYVACSDWETASETASFQYMNPLLRRYWRQYPLSLTA
jgi:uncharacterized protein